MPVVPTPLRSFAGPRDPYEPTGRPWSRRAGDFNRRARTVEYQRSAHW